MKEEIGHLFASCSLCSCKHNQIVDSRPVVFIKLAGAYDILDQIDTPRLTMRTGFLGVNYRALKGAASHFIAKTCITEM